MLRPFSDSPYLLWPNGPQLSGAGRETAELNNGILTGKFFNNRRAIFFWLIACQPLRWPLGHNSLKADCLRLVSESQIPH